MVNPYASPNFTFFTRVADLPLVRIALTYADKQYTGLMTSDRTYIKMAVENAEKAVKFTAAMAQPIVCTLRKPLLFIDDAACQALDVLETETPVIKMTPAQISEAAREAYETRGQSVVKSIDNLIYKIVDDIKDDFLYFVGVSKDRVQHSANQLVVYGSSAFEQLVPAAVKDLQSEYPREKITADMPMYDKLVLLLKKFVIVCVYNYNKYTTYTRWSEYYFGFIPKTKPEQRELLALKEADETRRLAITDTNDSDRTEVSDENVSGEGLSSEKKKVEVSEDKREKRSGSVTPEEELD